MGKFDKMENVRKENVRKEIYVPILGIIIAELLMFFGKNFIFYGFGIHIINLLVIIFVIIFSSIELEEKNILQSMILLILLRVVNLSMPQFFTTTLLQYPMIYGVMILPIYYIIKNQQISSKELGIDFRKFYVYLPIGVIVGTIMAIIEYKILNPVPLIDKINISNIILITIVMFVFVGLVEEIIFRSILQTRIEKMCGMRYGIILSGILFGIMHTSYGIINEIIFATVFGIVLGYIFQKTRSLPFIGLIHGTANIMSFGILSKILFLI